MADSEAFSDISPESAESPYDAIADLYDPWSASVREDLSFYVEIAVDAGGPVVELGVGTGRVALTLAHFGIRVIGVDSSPGMLRVCRERAERAGLADRLDLRLGDFREPPVSERVNLVICPFRSFLHLQTEEDRRRALRATYDMLLPGGQLVFDIFAPSRQDVEETHGRWIEREPGIFERADWDTGARTLTLSVKGEGGRATLSLAWVSPLEWRMLLREAGFVIEACYGWFDRRRYRGGEDTIWLARKPAERRTE